MGIARQSASGKSPVIACAQLVCASGDLPRNTSLMAEMAAEAARMRARVVVFPELCLSGYCSPSEAARLAVSAGGPEISRLHAVARQTGVALCFGFPERAPDGLSNSMVFLDTDGAAPIVYRKIHLWVTERGWAAEGKRLVSFGLDGLRCGMWICYDTRFPEAARALATRGVTHALVGSAWFGPAAEWELAVRARALDNGIFVAGAAAQGSFGNAPFHGESLIVDPHGNILARAPEGHEGVIAAECDNRAVDSFRARLPLLQDMRPASCAVEERP
ncbi:MAG: carbon-nitrogen hydrolase family protein [Spirochaetia bacterium]